MFLRIVVFRAEKLEAVISEVKKNFPSGVTS